MRQQSSRTESRKIALESALPNDAQSQRDAPREARLSRTSVWASATQACSGGDRFTAAPKPATSPVLMNCA